MEGQAFIRTLQGVRRRRETSGERGPRLKNAAPSKHNPLKSLVSVERIQDNPNVGRPVVCAVLRTGEPSLRKAEANPNVASASPDRRRGVLDRP